ncbi:hypothetical protein [Nocardia asiatica]|uniref:hypothetical protein n=1 Tax=Nocardia asiatica TaxID=209252 RepID=UPI00245873CF|nr:hypothetical protein [Nocardia asiatica]
MAVWGRESADDAVRASLEAGVAADVDVAPGATPLDGGALAVVGPAGGVAAGPVSGAPATGVAPVGGASAAARVSGFCAPSGPSRI